MEKGYAAQNLVFGMGASLLQLVHIHRRSLPRSTFLSLFFYFFFLAENR